MILEIMFFYIFQMAIGQHDELLRAQNFICWRCWEEWETSPCQIFFKTGLSKAEILRFFDFQNGRLHHLLFSKSPFFWLTVSRGSKLMSMSIFGKIGQSVAKILRFFRFFKPPSWIFKIVNFYLLTVSRDPYASLYLILWKSVVPLRIYCDFSNFQDGRRCNLGFLKTWNFIHYWGPELRDASACQIL